MTQSDMHEALKASWWFGERTRVGGRFFSDVLLDELARHEVASSVLLRATAGFGLAHHLRGDQLLTMSEDPSVLAIAVDRAERMEALLPELADLLPRGMLTVERARLADLLPDTLPGGLDEAIKLTVHLGRHERIGDRRGHLVVCDLLHAHGVAGASVLLGVDGTSRGIRERARFWDRNVDVPAMVVAVGAGEDVARAFGQLRALLPAATMTVERVRVCKRDGVLLARPHPLPTHDASGLGLWQKLSVYTSESDQHAGQPIHRALVRRLRSGGARGATAVRGVWGYHGDHRPHGDRLLQLGRRVPVVTFVVDTPDRIEAAFQVIDEVTGERGLVTSEMVPALRYSGPGTALGGVTRARHRY
ncbi:DUF190 domain-containing protein [Nocardioides terrisoli]|uniref:DUF190 domain-containing protein n=1 Tax=Nocardioides terrisoli TaxID=3388267 RepID=UPI00287BC7D7|nr:DUF190 domain-containing protein [Nocardioides marmorisolisilvae]